MIKVSTNNFRASIDESIIHKYAVHFDPPIPPNEKGLESMKIMKISR